MRWMFIYIIECSIWYSGSKLSDLMQFMSLFKRRMLFLGNASHRDSAFDPSIFCLLSYPQINFFHWLWNIRACGWGGTIILWKGWFVSASVHQVSFWQLMLYLWQALAHHDAIIPQHRDHCHHYRSNHPYLLLSSVYFLVSTSCKSLGDILNSQDTTPDPCVQNRISSPVSSYFFCIQRSLLLCASDECQSVSETTV